MSDSIGYSAILAWLRNKTLLLPDPSTFEKEFTEKVKFFGLTNDECLEIISEFRGTYLGALHSQPIMAPKTDDADNPFSLYEKIVKTVLIDGYDTKLDADHITNALPVLLPSFHDATYPREYVVPKSHSHPRLLSAARLLQTVFSPRPVGSLRIQFASLSRLCEFSVPTFFLGDSFLDAVINTSAPDDITLRDISWPMEAMLFSVPKGRIPTPDGYVTLLTVSRCPAGTLAVPVFPELCLSKSAIPRSIDASKLKQFFGEDFERLQHCTSPGFDKPSIIITAISNKSLTYGWQQDISDISIAAAIKMTHEYDKDMGQAPGVVDFAALALPHIGLQTVLIMAACPDVVERPIADRPAREKHGVKTPTLWKPNFVGRRFYSPAPAGDESASSGHRKRMHWRRGHVRHQPFGKGLSERRIVWIRPILVSSEQEARDIATT